MYITDGRDYDYAKVSKNCFAWGWLSSKHPFLRRWDCDKEKQDFLSKLSKLEVVDLCRGVHIDEGLGLLIWSGANGSLKFVADGVTYVAPVAVIYFIGDLGYRPPKEVFDAMEMNYE